MNMTASASVPLKYVFFIFTVFTLGWMIIMSWSIKPLNSKEIVSYELAKTPEVALKIRNDWEERGLLDNAKKSIYLDFVFLVLYVATIGIGCAVLSVFTDNDFLMKTGRIISMTLPLAGLFDAIENVAMLKTLSGDITVVYTAIAFWFASMKFFMVIFSLVFILCCLIVGVVKKIGNH